MSSEATHLSAEWMRRDEKEGDEKEEDEKEGDEMNATELRSTKLNQARSAAQKIGRKLSLIWQQSMMYNKDIKTRSGAKCFSESSEPSEC